MTINFWQLQVEKHIGLVRMILKKGMSCSSLLIMAMQQALVLIPYVHLFFLFLLSSGAGWIKYYSLDSNTTFSFNYFIEQTGSFSLLWGSIGVGGNIQFSKMYLRKQTKQPLTSKHKATLKEKNYKKRKKRVYSLLFCLSCLNSEDMEIIENHIVKEH